MRTRTKLVKTAVEVEKPSIKWVVQTVCCGCGAVCGDGSCTQGCADGSCTHGCANGAGCAAGCADGACTSGAPAGAAAQAPIFSQPPVPPAPLRVHEASYQSQTQFEQPQHSALLEAIGERR
ncbi:MAG: hypothetical protein QM775_13455 [Pirellulales bacterium]